MRSRRSCGRSSPSARLASIGLVDETLAVVFALVTGLVVAFQVALALGAPWGAYAMGGAFPGRMPPPLRVAALIQALPCWRRWR